MLFPNYDVSSPVISTARTIDRCVTHARDRIEQHEKEILTAARTIDRQATIMLTVALNKLSHVQRIPLDDAWGQASDTAIDISNAPMRESYMLGTLIHEALHDCFYHAEGHAFSEEEEHQVMYVLGEI